MQHPDPDDLALLALGESPGDAVDAHVADCAVCAGEIESFRMTVDLAELSNFGEDAPRPGEHVWQAIAAELGFEGNGMTSGAVATAIGESGPFREQGGHRESATPAQESPTVPQPGVSTGPKASATSRPRSVPGSEQPTPPAAVGPPSSSATSPGSGARTGSAGGSGSASSGRWSRWVAPLAAAVVGIAVGAGAVVLSQDRTDDVTIEAVAPLKPVADGPLGGDTATLGEAELLAVSNGRQVRVTADQLPPSRNAYEVWLFGDDGRMVALGTLNDRSGSFTVPQGINTQEYRVVDISDEAPDGNPAHSGISLIRGEFN